MSDKVDEMLMWNEAQNKEIVELTRKASFANGRAATAANRLVKGASRNVLYRVLTAVFIPQEWGK